MRTAMLHAAASLLTLCACTAPAPHTGGQAKTEQPPLVGTEWRLTGFQSPKGSIGMVRPRDGETYTLQLAADGQVAMQLFCNRGAGRWASSDPSSRMADLTINLAAVTSAACLPSPLERIVTDMANVRSFVIQDGLLHLNLKIDSGSYIWEPMGGAM